MEDQLSNEEENSLATSLNQQEDVSFPDITKRISNLCIDKDKQCLEVKPKEFRSVEEKAAFLRSIPDMGERILRYKGYYDPPVNPSEPDCSLETLSIHIRQVARSCRTGLETLQEADDESKSKKGGRTVGFRFDKHVFDIDKIPHSFKQLSKLCALRVKLRDKMVMKKLTCDQALEYLKQRQVFEHEKMKAVCRDLDAIDFNALNITSDPETNINIKNICKMMMLNSYHKTLKHPPGRIIPCKILSSHSSQAEQQNMFVDINLVKNHTIEQTLPLQIEDGTKQERAQITETDDINNRPMLF